VERHSGVARPDEPVFAADQIDEPEPELQFQPAPNATYDIVDKALAIVKGSGITKFGFVGNEQYRVFGKAARPGN
jgi:hypothetical protein